MDERDIERLLHSLGTDVAVIVVRVDGHAEAIDELKEVTRYIQRLLISTMIAVLLGVAMGVFGIVLT